MNEKTQQLIEAYDKQRKRTRAIVWRVLLIVAGAALIISAFLFRTQYPLTLKDKGLLHYNYSHILLRDETNYDYFNNVKGHSVRYYIVYRNASLYYEHETNFAVYSAHAAKENAQPGITNHAVIRESLERYTFVARDGKTYCYEEPTGKFKALFDASYAGGKIYVRFLCYFLGTAAMVTGVILLVKRGKEQTHEEAQ